MWVILGNKVETQRVPNGRRVERTCTACGETAMFYEREVSKSFRLYFVSVFNYETQRVMACGACGACYATDELGRPLSSEEPAGDKQKGTLFGGVKDALRRAGNALQDATGVKADEDVVRADASDEERAPGEPAKKTIQPEAKRLPAGEGRSNGKRAAPAEEPDDFDDPLADDPLEERFKALERKMTQTKSTQKPIK
jgi:hypothetical protein